MSDPFETLDLPAGEHDPEIVRIRAERMKRERPQDAAAIDAAAAVLGDGHRQACYRAERFLRKLRHAGTELSERDLVLAAGSVGEILGPQVDLEDFHRSVGRPGEHIFEEDEARRRFTRTVNAEVRLRWREFRSVSRRRFAVWALVGAALLVASLLPWTLGWFGAAQEQVAWTGLPAGFGSLTDLLLVALTAGAYGAAVGHMVGVEIHARRRSWVAAMPALAASWVALVAGWGLLRAAPLAALGVASVGTWLASMLLPKPGARQAAALWEAGIMTPDRSTRVLDDGSLDALWDETLGDWAMRRAQYRTRRLENRTRKVEP